MPPTKRTEINGKFYRKRRGKLVEIPEEWLGQTVHPQKLRKRNTVSRRTRMTKKKHKRS